MPEKSAAARGGPITGATGIGRGSGVACAGEGYSAVAGRDPSRTLLEDAGGAGAAGGGRG